MAKSDDSIGYEIIAYWVSDKYGWGLTLTYVEHMEAVNRLKNHNIDVEETLSVCKGVLPVSQGIKDQADFVARVAIGHGWTWDDKGEFWRQPYDPKNPDILPVYLAGTPTVVDSIEVTFDPADVGWQPVTIGAGAQTADFEACYAYDPFPNILRWLELILEGGQGKQSASLFSGVLELFAFNTCTPNRARIVITNVLLKRIVMLDIDIDRELFVREVYSKFRAYAESKDYDPAHWGIFTLRDDLRHKGYPNDPSVLAATSSAALNEMFCKVCPGYLILGDNVTDRDKERARLTEDLRSGVETLDPEYVIPDAFEAWTPEARLQHITEMLQEDVTSYDAAYLTTLTSDKLEELLRKGDK